MGLEVPWIPHLTHELPETLRQQAHDVTRWELDVNVVLLFKKVVPEGDNVCEGLLVNN